MDSKLLEFMQSMKHNPVRNYGGIPGLTSWLIGAPSMNGLVRLMECSRDHSEPIIPHSHRFNFRCLVLKGSVLNIIWRKVVNTQNGDMYQCTTMQYGGVPGQYRKEGSFNDRWFSQPATYNEGDEYSMQADDVHSIFFSRGTAVLFFEGPPVSDNSVILEPFVDGELVPTFKVEPWAFKTGTDTCPF